MNHTPGPWHASQTNGTWYVNDERTHLDLWMGSDGVENPEADARLIAAAPDLLAALEEVLTSESHYWLGTPEGNELVRRVRAAIDKAKGVREEVTR